jgi:hypothetical protein
MSHYAKVKDGKVIKVIVAEASFFDTFVDTSAGKWIQTSYNTKKGVHYQSDGVTPSADQSKALRKNYAGIGYTYDDTKDAFIPPKPFNSWTLNETTCYWEPPVAKPDDVNKYNWNEETTSWDLVSE